MARPLRIEYPNASYHVVNRGNHRATVFHDDWHYQEFVDKLGLLATDFRVVVHAYCCMPNHFHLYLRTPDANLSRFMQNFLTSFGVASNKKRRSSGHIFQGRFKAQLVDDECYRSRLSRYIHLNPIRTQSLRKATLEERHDHLHQFKWSSYRCYLGVSKTPPWLDCGPVLSCWGEKKREQVRNYAVYVEEGLRRNLESPFDDMVKQTIIGSDRFVDWVKREHLLRRPSNKGEEPALVHLQQSFSIDDIINHVALVYDVDRESIRKRKSPHRVARRLAMYCACVYCRYNHGFSDLARQFSVSVSALTQARDQVLKNSPPKVRAALREIEGMIAKT